MKRKTTVREMENLGHKLYHNQLGTLKVRGKKLKQVQACRQKVKLHCQHTYTYIQTHKEPN